MSPGKRRKVTFADEPSVVTFQRSTDQSEEQTPPGTQGMLGSLVEDSTNRGDNLVDKGGGGSQPAVDLHDMQGVEDTSILEDLAEAEEDYDRPEQAFNEAGVAFEPFHLKKEREEGYFDPDGNYIQYKLDEVKDAWLDSLADGTFSSTTSATAVASAQAGKQSQEPAMELDADELHTYKRRLTDLLQPQETVLAALRRLGGLQGTSQAGSDALPWKRARKAAGSSGSSSASRGAAPSPTGASAPAMRSGRTVPVENREAFDRLTEYSSLLLQHGDYSIHSTPREQLVAQTDAAMAAQLQAVMGVLSTSCTSTASDTSAQTSDTGIISATFSGSAPLFSSHRANPRKRRAMPGSNQEEELEDMDADAAAPSAAELASSSVTEEAAKEAAGEQAVPADPDEDIFGGAEPQQLQAWGVHDPAGQVSTQSCDETVSSSDNAHQGDRLGLCSYEIASSVSTSVLPASQDSASGFVYDDSSGTWFNADLGYFYDATQGLYGDASSGKWYTYVDGMYHLVC